MVARQTRIMYIEKKSGGLAGPARIGRVTYSNSGATKYYRGRTLQSLLGRGYKSNFFDLHTGESFWISGPKKRGGDALYPTNIPMEIDEDAREEYWTSIRNRPERKHEGRTL